MNSIEVFSRLEQAFEQLVKSLDRSILLDYCRRLEPMAYARYFKGYRPQTLGRKRVTEALHGEVYDKKNEALADILVLLWNQGHRELYQSMLELVKTINENVEEIESIPDDKAAEFVEELEARFDKADILICVCLNEVRFSDQFIESQLGGKSASQPTGEPSPPEVTDIEPEPSRSEIGE